MIRNGKRTAGGRSVTNVLHSFCMEYGKRSGTNRTGKNPPMVVLVLHPDRKSKSDRKKAHRVKQNGITNPGRHLNFRGRPPPLTYMSTPTSRHLSLPASRRLTFLFAGRLPLLRGRRPWTSSPKIPQLRVDDARAYADVVAEPRLG